MNRSPHPRLPSLSLRFRRFVHRLCLRFLLKLSHLRDRVPRFRQFRLPGRAQSKFRGHSRLISRVRARRRRLHHQALALLPPNNRSRNLVPLRQPSRTFHFPYHYPGFRSRGYGFGRGWLRRQRRHPVPRPVPVE